MDIHERCEMACQILQKTLDGNDLAPSDLYFTECAVNGLLTAEGYDLFTDLHKRVMSGEYKKPWLFGIENLTMDHSGYVYWKNIGIEHFTFYNEGGRTELMEYSKRLAVKCQELEDRGIPVTGQVIWDVEYPSEVPSPGS